MESAPSLRPAAAALGDWIGPRLGPFGGWVGSVVPHGYDAYVRVLHPVGDGTWAAVFAATGTTPHALMQWPSISRGWTGDEPSIGDAGDELTDRLLAVLAPFTTTECVVALWGGYGGIDGRGVLVVTAWDASEPHPDPLPPPFQPPPAYDAATLAAPRLRLPNRDYLVFSGPLAAVPSLGDRSVDGHLFRQSPNLLWPRDRSWFLGTEIDFDSTLIAGSTALVDAVLAADGVEAWPVGPDDSLAYDADVVNGLPPA